MALVKVGVWGTLYSRVLASVYNYLVLKTDMPLYKAVKVAELVARPFYYLDRFLEISRIIEVIV